MRGLVFQPLFCMILISGLYLLCLCMRSCSRNLLWQYVNLMNWIVCLGEGNKDVCVWFGTLMMHNMYGLSLAWHWHILCGHVHLRSHYGIVWFGGWLIRLQALVKVKNWVFSLAYSVWVMRWTALLCLAIHCPFKYGCSHVDNRWGHVSLSLLWHSVQLGFWYLRDQQILEFG